MNTHKRIQSTLFAILIIGFANNAAITPASAANAEHAALTILKQATYNMIEALKKASKSERGDARFIRKLVNTHLAPNIDFIASSKWVLGKHWRRANLEQKKTFIRQFKKLLVQFYSAALSEYAVSAKIDHNILSFLPVRNAADDDDITVHSRVNTPSGKVIPVNYHVHKTRKGDWKVYDVSVEGISMISTYRASFAAELKQNGVTGIIASLKQRNAKLTANVKPTQPKLVKIKP